MGIAPSETGVKCLAYTFDGKAFSPTGSKDVGELKKGEYVKEAYEPYTYHLVTGPTVDDGIDWMVETEDGRYSPLLLV